MKFDINAYMKAHARICFLHDAVEGKRILPEDIADLTELAATMHSQIIQLKRDAGEQLAKQGFFVKPGDLLQKEAASHEQRRLAAELEKRRTESPQQFLF